MTVSNELIDRLLADYKKPEDLIGENGLLKQLTKRLGGSVRLKPRRLGISAFAPGAGSRPDRTRPSIRWSGVASHRNQIDNPPSEALYHLRKPRSSRRA